MCYFSYCPYMWQKVMKILLKKVFGPSFKKIKKIGKMRKKSFFWRYAANMSIFLTKVGFACMVGPRLSNKSYCESKNVVGKIWKLRKNRWPKFWELLYAKQCTDLPCITLRCTRLHCIALRCAASYCIILHSILLHCVPVHCIKLYCIVLHCIGLCYIA